MSHTVPSDWPLADSFYGSPNWLRFVDSDDIGLPFYTAIDGTGIVAHHAPHDRHPDYRSTTLLGIAESGSRLLLGGRRGFCSPIVTSNHEPPALAPLIGAALDAHPDVDGNWWWPYLRSKDVPHVVAAARALTGEDPGVHLVGAECAVDLAQSGEQFESSLPKKQRRTNWRREWQRFEDSGLELREVSIDEIVTAGAPLLQQVEHKYGNSHSEQHLRSFLARQARFLSDAAVVHAIFDGSRMTGYSLSYRWRDELAVRLIGLDYAALRNSSEYAVLLMHGPVRFARANGIEALHLGMDGYEAKCRRGARVRALWAVAPRTTTSGTSIFERADSIMSKLPAAESAMFRDEIDTLRPLPATAGGSP